MKHCMIDLETWGLAPGSALRSIGAVMFDPFRKKLGNEFYMNVEKESCIGWGLTVDPKTEEWWSQQSPEARAALETGSAPLSYAISAFDKWFTENKAEFIWSHGANFDIVLLERAYAALNVAKVPWNYRATRDTRTLYWLAGVDLAALPKIGVEHNALHDAINQARAVQISAERVFPHMTMLFEAEGR